LERAESLQACVAAPTALLLLLLLLLLAVFERSGQRTLG
jgi:hypothetical protein